VYVIESIGGLFDGAPLPLDSSWLPPELREVPTLPDGTSIIPQPAPPPSSPPSSPVVPLVLGAAVGGAIVYLLLRR
jgi:hypothetical protein